MKQLIAILAVLLFASVASAQVGVRTEKASGLKLNLSPLSGAVVADTATSVAFVDYLTIYQLDASDVVVVKMKNGATVDTLVHYTTPATLLETAIHIPIGVKVSTSDSLIVTKSAATTGFILVYRTGY